MQARIIGRSPPLRLGLHPPRGGGGLGRIGECDPFVLPERPLPLRGRRLQHRRPRARLLLLLLRRGHPLLLHQVLVLLRLPRTLLLLGVLRLELGLLARHTRRLLRLPLPLFLALRSLLSL